MITINEKTNAALSKNKKIKLSNVNEDQNQKKISIFLEKNKINASTPLKSQEPAHDRKRKLDVFLN